MRLSKHALMELFVGLPSTDRDYCNRIYELHLKHRKCKADPRIIKGVCKWCLKMSDDMFQGHCRECIKLLSDLPRYNKRIQYDKSVQVRAFMKMWDRRDKKKDARSLFSELIVLTSDDNFQHAVSDRPDSIRVWERMYQ